ncbi:MAG: phenylacetic acid degradation protein PaaD [Glaciihabitans sp.]|nr:phenylacetic acid degradation protein PaaD [Glaciihabitans sp.]
MTDIEDERTAWDVVEALYASDEAILALGITVVDVQPGAVELGFTPRAEMGNGHGIVHGGYLFLLADTAFAYAFATRGENGVTVNATIDFLAPAHVNKRLTAVAREFHRDGVAGIYDVKVTDSNGRVVAAFRGHGRVPRSRNPRQL